MSQDPDDRVERAESRERDVPQRMRDAITSTIEQTRRAASRAGDALPDTGDIQAGAMNAMNAVRENPLGLFFGMVAVGFAIGSLIPVTRIENEQLSPLVAKMRTRAKDEMQVRYERMRDVAVSAITNPGS